MSFFSGPLSFVNKAVRFLFPRKAQPLELRGPVTISLEITARCNGCCPGCSNVFPHTGEDMPIESWEKIIQGLSPLVEEFRITGGEPTLREDLPEFLDLLESTGKYYHIFTNGLWSDPEKLVSIFQRGAHLASFLFSLHGITPEVHSSFGKGGDLSQVLESIHRAIGGGFDVNTNTVLTRKNIHQIEEIVKKCQEIGVRTMVFARYIGKDHEEFSLPDEQLRAALDCLARLQSQGYNVMIGNCVPACFHRETGTGCLAGITFATVDPRGNLRPCNHSPTICGNLLEEPIEKLWKDKPMRNWRNTLPDPCYSCRKITICPGGCKAEAELLGLAADPLIKEPITDTDDALLEVNLEEDLCPYLNARTREEDFGIILIRSGHVVPLTRQGKTIISALDGNTALKELERRFGPAAISFIYSLYVRNFVELKSPS
ncbi:MAG: radical SAM protein [Candidatus Eremiobacteraeota bacterium]|nr:radical SAM protein [Candidatus Eremiobacteraeota bacterium]